MKNRNFVLFLAFIAIIASGCSRKESLAQAAETGSTVAAATPAVASTGKVNQSEESVKHQVMAFDLEGLADDGSKKWDVKGQSAESVTESQVKLNNVVANSYGKEGQATITADTGLYDKSKNNVRLEQNVKAVIENTKASADGFIKIGPTEASAAQDTQTQGTDQAKQKKTKTEITCDAEVEFNYEKNEGYFNKNVHVVNEEGTIDADKITVYLDRTTKTIKTIVAEGNVKIKRGENTTFSDQATYIAADKKIVLSGQPKLVIYQEGGEDPFAAMSKK